MILDLIVNQIKGKIGEKVLNVFTAELKDDKRKLIDDAVAELKNAGGDAPAAAAKARVAHCSIFEKLVFAITSKISRI